MQPYLLAMVALFLKMFAVTAAQARARLGSGRLRWPEDRGHWGRKEAAEGDDPVAIRGQQALRNDLENIPWFLFLGLAYVLLDCWPSGRWIYFPLFVLARSAHSVFFLWPRQPHRNRAYVLGLAVNFALAAHVTWATLQLESP